MDGQFHAPTALPTETEPPVTHCVEGWVGPRIGLEVLAKKKSCPGNEKQTQNWSEDKGRD